MIRKVELSKRAMKDLRVMPIHIVVKLKSWVELVETVGLDATRKNPGYHDEPLKGKRIGQRSIRLSRGYRAIYVVRHDDLAEIVCVREVSKHEY
jgi:proteic killer suppression protein